MVLFGEDAHHVDRGASAKEIDPRLLAFGCTTAELHDGCEVYRLHELLKVHCRRMFHAGVGGADSGFEAVGGGLVRSLALLELLGG